MFRINKDKNSIVQLEKRSFSELDFRERPHLQEWIAKSPSCLGEELLIIQKEFAGFSGTRERLDLLALDKEGRLVIIENKLDDSGTDVTWQAMKYASYCESLNTEKICSIYQEHLTKEGQPGTASELIADFLEVDDLSETSLNFGVSQRIMLIAAKFRDEVTSTVLWLRKFKLHVRCFRVKLWMMGKHLFLNFEEIIPVHYMIGLADKAQDEAQKFSKAAAMQTMYPEFWTEVIRVMNTKSNLYDNKFAGVGHWIGTGAGMQGVGFNFVARATFGRAEIFINRRDQAENGRIFDHLRGSTQNEVLENAFGESLEWKRSDHAQPCRIKCETKADMLNRENWQSVIEFMTDAMVRLEKAFRDPIQELNAEPGFGNSEPDPEGNGQ